MISLQWIIIIIYLNFNINSVYIFTKPGNKEIYRIGSLVKKLNLDASKINS